ncbi:ATP-binding protein [Piscinibacter terrae]|nr:ATP-binding protein [Albitalea terrae]
MAMADPASVFVSTPGSPPTGGGRPSLWPHRPAEGELREEIGAPLRQALEAARRDPDRARALLDEALAMARASDDPTVLPRSLHRAAVIALRLRDPCAAYVMCVQAQPLLERLDDRWRSTEVLKLRGRCCLDAGENELAETLLAEAADRFERMGSPMQTARCHSLLSAAYRRQGNLLAAVHFAQQACSRMSEAPRPVRHRLLAIEAMSRLELSRRLRASGEERAADDELDAALRVLPPAEAVDTDAGAQSAAVLGVIVRVAAERGDLAARMSAYQRLLRLARRLDDPVILGLAWLRGAECRIAQGRPAAARNDALRAIDHLLRASHSPMLPEAERVLAGLLEGMGDSRGAYEAFGAALHHEAEQERAFTAARLELLSLHAKAERDLRETEQTLAYAQRFSNVGYLVASVNHELNQPLASIRLLAETTIELARHGHREEVKQSLRSMVSLSGRLTDLASKLAAFPVRENAPLRSVSLRAAIDEALSLVQSRLAQTPCQITRFGADAQVQADEGQVVHVIANLVNNAIDAMAGQAQRRIHFSCTAGPSMVQLTICDNGPGFAPAVHERLFHPFFSTKAAGQGLGLGLALSRDALRAMGGELSAYNDVDGGAAFELSLPRVLP